MPVGKPCPYCYCVSPKLAARNEFGFLGLPGASFQCIICITYQELPRVTALQNTVSQMHKACLTAYSVHHSLGQILQHTSPHCCPVMSSRVLSVSPIWSDCCFPFPILYSDTCQHGVWKCCPSKNRFLLSSRIRNSPHSSPLPSPASPTFRRSCHFWVSINQQCFNTFYSSRFFSVCIVLVSRSACQFWENLVCITLFISLHYSSDSRIQRCCALQLYMQKACHGTEQL